MAQQSIPHQSRTHVGHVHGTCLVSALLLETDGELGGSSQVGKPPKVQNETLDGQSPLDSNFSSTLLTRSSNRTATSPPLLTTWASSRDGGPAVTTTQKPIPSSSKSTISSLTRLTSLTSTPNMYPVKKTPLTALHEASTHHDPSSFHAFQSQILSSRSSLMPQMDPPPQNSAYSGKEPTNPTQTKSLTALGSNKRPMTGSEQLNRMRTLPSTMCSSTSEHNNTSRFNAPLRLDSPSSTSITPHPYQIGLTPLPSQLHTHCLAKERLCLWLSANNIARILASSNNPDTPITDQQLNRILEVIGASWVDGTKESYRSN
ncbi:hypothetical protein BDN67DRAFT_1016330 [Paxillus ammoniavirescens]|nr:hypothetical protein BDN67DRAFT_1016330 [Paxillus ammoniavirescens]